MQPDSHWQSEGNRYAFNGKEKDDEVKTWTDGQGDVHPIVGAQYDYGFRIYDPTIAKFLSVDPLTADFPWYTPYQFAGNKPIANIDMDGLEEWYYQNGQLADGIAGPLSAKAQSDLGVVTREELESALENAASVSRGLHFGLNGRFQVSPSRVGTGRGKNTTVTGLLDMEAGRINSNTGRPRGASVVRVDGPHSSTPYPHLNIESGYTGVPDPHIKISNTTLKVAEGAGTILNGASKVAAPVGIGLDVYAIGSAIERDGGTFGENTASTTGGVVGGWAGAWAGGVVGVEIGATIGSIGGPVGTAIGGFAGGLIGGISGAFVGQEAGEDAGELIWEKYGDR